MTFEAVPGLVETKQGHGETTLVVDPARLREASLHLRDQLGFNFLSDITPTDYLGWPQTKKQVAGYKGSSGGRDINSPGSWGHSRLPDPRPTRFCVNYHLLAVPAGGRVRVQVWVEDAEAVQSVVSVWPTADWHEREAFDLMGIPFEGHPNLRRIIMDDDWEGHPLRKDYPIGGEPVRFSGEE